MGSRLLPATRRVLSVRVRPPESAVLLRGASAGAQPGAVRMRGRPASQENPKPASPMAFKPRRPASNPGVGASFTRAVLLVSDSSGCCNWPSLSDGGGGGNIFAVHVVTIGVRKQFCSHHPCSTLLPFAPQRARHANRSPQVRRTGDAANGRRIKANGV